MPEAHAASAQSPAPASRDRSGWTVTLPRWVFGKLRGAAVGLLELGAFTMVTLTVVWRNLGLAHRVLKPEVARSIVQSSLKLMPVILLIALAIGFVVIGQAVSLLSQVGAQTLLGNVMVTVVVREFGPILAAMLVLARSGTANVIELGTLRARGEVESLESIGIDPIHYLVVPRVIGMGLGLFALTLYLNVGAILSGYVWAFLQDIPITLQDYFYQLAMSLKMVDFILLPAKTLLFGIIIAMATSFHGLARRLRLEEIAGATIRAVGQSLMLCVIAEIVFIVLYVFL